MLGILHIFAPKSSAATLATNYVRDILGIAATNHVIEYPYTNATPGWEDNAFMTNSAGIELAWQRSGDMLLVLTNCLAFSTNTLILADGRPRTNWFNNRYGFVSVITNYSTNIKYMITNGLVGVGVVNPLFAGSNLAPVQAVIDMNGVLVLWTNYLFRGESLYASLSFPQTNANLFAATNITQSMIDFGPTRVSVQTVYEFSRPDFYTNGVLAYAAGRGYLTNITTLEAFSQSVILDDRSDVDELSYHLNLAKVMPHNATNMLRWRNNYATLTNFGKYEFTGEVYDKSEVRAATGREVDAIWELNGKEMLPSYLTLNWVTNFIVKRSRAGTAFDSGDARDCGVWYQMANTNAPSTNTVIGVFDGPASTLRGSMIAGGFAPHVLTNWHGMTNIGFSFKFVHRAPSALTIFHHRQVKGLWLGRNSQLIRQTNSYFSQINHDWLRYAGAARQTKYQGYFSDAGEKATWGRIYRDSTNWQHTIRNDAAFKALQASIEGNADGDEIINAMGDGTGALTTTMFNTISNQTYEILWTHSAGPGQYGNVYNDLQGSQYAQRQAPKLDMALWDPTFTGQTRYRARVMASMLARFQNEADFAPYQIPDALLGNAGTADFNFRAQVGAAARVWQLLMTHDAVMAALFSTASNAVYEAMTFNITPGGTMPEGTGYIGALGEPTDANSAQLEVAGSSITWDQRFTNRAKFYSGLATPEEVRIGTGRIFIQIGDGAHRGAPFPGYLAALLQTRSPAVSANMQWLWYEMWTNGAGYALPATLIADSSLTSTMPTLKHEQLDRYATVMRFQPETKRESQIVLYNGQVTAQHDGLERGAAFLYLLGAPVSIRYGSFYTPNPGGANIASGMTSASSYPAWNGTDPSLLVTYDWTARTNRTWVALNATCLADCVSTNGSNREWTRTMRSVQVVSNLVFVLVQDRFIGPGAASPMISSWNNVSTGIVQTSSGPITPTPRTNANDTVYPTASTILTLQPGVRKISFQGENWPNHDAGGVNWDHYVSLSMTNDLVVKQLRVVHSQTPPLTHETMQHLHQQSTNGFNRVIVGWSKGMSTNALLVSTNGNGDWQASYTNGQHYLIASNHTAYNDGTNRRVLAVFNSVTTVNTNGLGVTNGPAEIDLNSSNQVLTAHGAAGYRNFARPRWVNEPFGTAYVAVKYAGGEPLTVTVSTTNAGGFASGGPSFNELIEKVRRMADGRPHPGPLPQERGKLSRINLNPMVMGVLRAHGGAAARRPKKNNNSAGGGGEGVNPSGPYLFTNEQTFHFAITNNWNAGAHRFGANGNYTFGTTNLLISGAAAPVFDGEGWPGLPVWVK